MVTKELFCIQGLKISPLHFFNIDEKEYTQPLHITQLKNLELYYLECVLTNVCTFNAQTDISE